MRAGILSTIILISYGSLVFGQSREELEERKRNTQLEIENTNNLLQETQKSRVATLNKVGILNKRIELRTELINSYNQEIEIIDSEISEKEILIENLQNDLENVRSEYEKLIVYAYWNRNSQDRLMFILSAENFNQAYKRMRYVQLFTKYRKEQANMIVALQDAIIEEIEILEESRTEKEGLAREKTNENSILQREISDNSQIISELRKRERELKRKIEENRIIADKLEEEILAIIEEEMKKSSSGSMYDQLTPEEKLISDNFMGNRGKLPWPTERGVIVDRFGTHQHPVLKQITIQNDGIDISTVQGAEARALFDGVVSRVDLILGANTTVIIRHGNFLTVYQNLVDVRVVPGERVEVKQVIGRVYTEKETSSTILHLEIWQEMNKQDPEQWLSPRIS
jgi:septal ring factor EnvC (AmiA/AmiB activator)